MSRRRDDAKRARREARQTTDPTTVPGTIVDPTEDPYARDSVVVDSSNAVLLDHTSAAIVHMTRNGQPTADAVGITLAGRVNRRVERAEVLYLMDVAGAAALVAEVVGVLSRSGHGEAFTAELDAALEQMPT